MSQLRLPQRPRVRQIPEIRGFRTRGTPIATGMGVSRAILVLASCTSLMGCLITRDPSFDPAENLPPSVHSSAETPMRSMIPFLLGDAPGGADAGLPTGLTFVATVRDPNPQDVLRARYYVDLDLDDPADGLVNEFNIRPMLDSDPFSRRVSFTVPRSLIGPGCNRVELYVSRAFATGLGPNPVDSEDLGSGVWFVGGRSDPTDMIDMNDCLALP